MLETRASSPAVWAFATLVGVSVAASFSSTVFAQGRTNTGARPAESALAEVVITAQKREERLQDVPISVAVISADNLGAFNMNQATDLQFLVPGLQLNNAAGPRSFGFFIRGVGTTSFSSESIEGSVAYVLDGVVLGQAGASLADLPDIERIEVLRGPQGTLFGKNASAGVVNIVTRSPTDEFTGKATVSWADPFNERKAGLVMSGPISDSVGWLLSARVNQRDGMLDNVLDGRELNDRDDYGFRGKLKFDPSDTLTATLSADYWESNANCCLWALLSTAPNPSAGELLSLQAGIRPGPENLKQNINGNVFAYVEHYGAAANVDWEVGSHTLTSITAYRNWETTDGLDTDNSPLNLLDVNFANFKQKQVTQEFRLASPTEGRLDYVVGLFYFDSTVDSLSTQIFPTINVPFQSMISDVHVETENMAVFGQANLALTDSLSLIAGARLLREEQSIEKQRIDPRLNLREPFQQQSDSDTATVWRGGLQYNFAPDFMVFATYTRGYKAGGFDPAFGLTGTPKVEPEIPTLVEVGARTVFPSLGLMFNVTLYDQEVEDYQVSTRGPGVNDTFFFIRNAAVLSSRGAEIDFAWNPPAADGFRLSGGLALIDAEWDSFPTAPCYPGQTAALGCVGGSQNLSGKPVPRAPEVSGNLTAQYGFPVGTAGYQLELVGGVNYRSEQIIYFPNDPDFTQDGFAMVDAALNLVAPDERWRASLFGRNLGDENFFASRLGVLFATPKLSTAYYPAYEARRIWGVSFEYNF